MKITTKSRKIQRVGYSLLVTLPLVWTTNVGIKEGDYVSMTMEEDGSLVVKKHEYPPAGR